MYVVNKHMSKYFGEIFLEFAVPVVAALPM